MTDIILCLGMIFVLLGLYMIFGRAASKILKLQLEGSVCLLFGVFVYYGIFQLAAVPMIFLKQPLSRLSIIWLGVLAVVAVGFLWLERKEPRAYREFLCPRGRVTVVKVLMALLAVLQIYYIITSEYLGWDTAAYIGTVETSVTRNSMYLYQGESGKIAGNIDLRYALSGFYMHSAVWCRVLRIRALYFAKIVQGGMLAVLADLTVFKLGCFFFSGKSYRGLVKEERVGDCAAGMVIAFMILNVFFDSMYATSDFLMSRALEAKAYCANFILPALLLFGLMLWREADRRETKACFFMAALSSVAISMSALVIAPALAVILLLPVICRQRTWGWIGYGVLCVLPNLFYLVLYLLYKEGIFVIGV